MKGYMNMCHAVITNPRRQQHKRALLAARGHGAGTQRERRARGASEEDLERAVRCCSDSGRQIRSLRKASEGAAGKKHKPKMRSGRNTAESGENGEDDQYLKTRKKKKKKRTVSNFYS